VSERQDVVRGGEFTEVGTGGRTNKEMGESVGAGIDGVDGLLQSADVDDKQFAAFVGGDGQRLECFFTQGRDRLRHTVFQAVIQNGLDVIGTFRDTGIHPGLRFLGLGKSGDRDAVFGPVSSRCGGEIPGREEARKAGRFFLLNDGCGGGNGEHVEIGCHSEDGACWRLVASMV